MSSIVESTPTALLGLILVGGSVLISGGAVVFVRRRFPRLQETGDTGILTQLVGVVFAVLMVFVVIALWEQYGEARITAEEEGAMLDSIWHMALAYPDEYAQPIVAAIANYADVVAHDEWAALAKGEESEAAWVATEELRQLHFRVDLPDTNRYSNLYFHSIEKLEAVTEHRIQRFIQSRTLVPGVVWSALIFGAVALLGLSLVAPDHSIPMQVVMTSTLAALIASTILVILMLDNPWSGDAALKPEAFEHIHSMQSRMQHDIISP